MATQIARLTTSDARYGTLVFNMNNLLRFSDYDVFAYLASGFATMAVLDIVLSTHLVLGASWTVSEALIAIVAAYVLGQMIAAPAAWVMERGLVGVVLGRPATLLMAEGRPARGLRGLLARTSLWEYYAPLDSGVAAAIRRAAPADAQAGGEQLFWRAYAQARADDHAVARLDGFLRLYGFCRNFAFVAVAAAIAFALTALNGAIARESAAAVARDWYLCAGAAVVAIGMTHRYLKFHRLYTLETLIVLARSAPKDATT